MIAIGRWSLGLALGALACTATSQERELPRHDGVWWLSISLPERSGFVAGYLDCHAYTRMRTTRFKTKGMGVYRDMITQLYQDSVSLLSAPVSAVLFRFRDRPGEEPPPGGEVHAPRPHGFFDGQYWKVIGGIGGPDEQIGFIEGHLSCYAEPPRDLHIVFSKTPAEYRLLITKWYRLVEETDEIDEERSHEPIANVLVKFRDGAPQP